MVDVDSDLSSTRKHGRDAEEDKGEREQKRTRKKEYAVGKRKPGRAIWKCEREAS